jgi:hypothetical protein
MTTEGAAHNGGTDMAPVASRSAWCAIVEECVPELWEGHLAELPAGLAIDVGHLAFLRLADHLDETKAEAVDLWLAEEADEAISQATASGRHQTHPFLGTSAEAQDELVERAVQAVESGVPPERVAQLVDPVEAADDTARSITNPWRSDPQVRDPLPTPDSMWRGRYRFGDYVTEIVLMGGQVRRLLGTVSPPNIEGVRLRDGAAWTQPDGHGRFRFESIRSGPTSVEIDTGPEVFVTEWTLL